jgi:hypothetical protein
MQIYMQRVNRITPRRFYQASQALWAAEKRGAAKVTDLASPSTNTTTTTIATATSNYFTTNTCTVKNLAADIQSINDELRKYSERNECVPPHLVTYIHEKLVNGSASGFDDDANKNAPLVVSKEAQWLRVYPLVQQQNWHELSELLDECIQMVPSQTLSYVAAELVKVEDRQTFLKLLDICNSFYKIPTQYIQEYINLCIKESDDQCLGKLFEKFILYTGPDERILEPVIDLDSATIERMISLFYKTHNVKEYTKLVAFYMKRIANTNKKLCHKWRMRSKFEKLNMYTDKLGPYKVLENGMFAKFRFSYSASINMDKDLGYFINSFVDWAHSEKRMLTLEELKIYLDFMHDLRTRKYKEGYSHSLNPDVQMARIYRSIIRRTENPDPMYIQKYNAIIEQANDGHFKHLKDGIPKHATTYQRMTAPRPGNVYFHPLYLNILLRILGKLTTSDTNYSVIAVLLFQHAVVECRMTPNTTTFVELLAIMHQHADTIPKEHLDSILSLHAEYVKGPNAEKTLLKQLHLRGVIPAPEV